MLIAVFCPAHRKRYTGTSNFQELKIEPKKNKYCMVYICCCLSRRARTKIKHQASIVIRVHNFNFSNLYLEYYLSFFLITMNEALKPWKESDAKAILTLEILDGTVKEESNPEEVYNSCLEYQQYNFTKFKRNMKALIKSLKNKEDQALFDAAAVAHDCELFPRPALTDGGYPFWDTSAAKTLLAADIDRGADKEMTPFDLWCTREEYQLFPHDVFRHHIHQERTKRKKFWRTFKKNKQNK
jgi:hypothetical protein